MAVLGTGKTRAALARRLAEAGSEMTVWNRTRSPAEEVGVGHVVATPADAVRAAEIVISSLTGPDALRATYGGPQGALSAASGQVFVQMSTAGPDVLAELEPQVVGTGSTLVDALSGCLRWCSAAQRRSSSVARPRMSTASGRCCSRSANCVTWVRLAAQHG
ncbi:MAG TPA: NAD(P)-binding domain-containing protein [Candidatus Dormibacteraeota bacterium]